MSTKNPLSGRRLKYALLIFAVAMLLEVKVSCAASTDTVPTSVLVSSSETVPAYTSTTVITSSCTTTTIFISSNTSITISTCAMTTQEKIEKFREKLPELKVQETVINVSPKMLIYLPSGAFDMALEQQYRKTTMEFNAKYDFVDSFMGFGLNFLYDLSPLSIGLNFGDTVDFSEIYSGTQYIQRDQFVTPYVQRFISRYTKIRTGMKFENTYTDAVASNFVLDQGRNMLGEIGVFNNSITESTSAPHGGSVSFNVQHSFKNLGSDYNYTQLEVNFRRYFTVFGNKYLECVAQAGYPVEVSNRPFTSLYYVGGYRILRGYQFKEFFGDALIYGTVKYNIPLNNPREADYFEHITVSFFTWNIFAEAAKIGTKDIYTMSIGEKFSAGTGLGYNIVLFRLFPIKLELSAAKALEDRPVYFYFTISTLYYTWRN